MLPEACYPFVTPTILNESILLRYVTINEVKSSCLNSACTCELGLLDSERAGKGNVTTILLYTFSF